MRLERIWAQQEKDRQVAEALAKFAAMQTELKTDKAGKQTKGNAKKTVTLTSKKKPSQGVLIKASGTG